MSAAVTHLVGASARQGAAQVGAGADIVAVCLVEDGVVQARVMGRDENRGGA
jgi:hypothetical protein